MTCSEPKTTSAYRGSKTEIDILLKDASDNPVDLSAKDIYFTMKKTTKDTDALFTLTKSEGITEIDYSSGKCRATIEGSHTVDLAPGYYVFDVKAGEKTYLFGTLHLWPVVRSNDNE